MFLQLNPQSPSESEVKEDDNETEHASAANNAHPYEQTKKKKKKRKKKSGKQMSSHRRSSEDNADVIEIQIFILSSLIIPIYSFFCNRFLILID